MPPFIFKYDLWDICHSDENDGGITVCHVIDENIKYIQDKTSSFFASNKWQQKFKLFDLEATS